MSPSRPSVSGFRRFWLWLSRPVESGQNVENLERHRWIPGSESPLSEGRAGRRRGARRGRPACSAVAETPRRTRARTRPHVREALCAATLMLAGSEARKRGPNVRAVGPVFGQAEAPQGGGRGQFLRVASAPGVPCSRHRVGVVLECGFWPPGPLRWTISTFVVQVTRHGHSQQGSWVTLRTKSSSLGWV